MKTDPYFWRSRRRHDVTLEQVEEVLRNEIQREVQPDGRVRIWGYLPEADKCVRVIFLKDGETLLNAFRDSSFTKKWRREQ